MLRKLGLASLVVAMAASGAMADSLADCSRDPNADARLRACLGTGDAANRRLREQEGQQLGAVIQHAAPNQALPLEIVDDEPYSALRKTIATFGADLLAMGTHARSRLSTAVVGSLAQEFLAAGPCDVLVARG